MELEELKTEIEDLHTKRQFSAIKTILKNGCCSFACWARKRRQTPL